MSSATAGALTAGAIALAAAPYLARLTLSVPDRGETRWWVGAAASGRRVAATAAVAVPAGVLGGTAARFTALLPAFVLYALVCAPLVVIDVEVQRLPNRLVFAWAGGATVLLAAAAVHDHSGHDLWRAGEGAAAVFAALFALRFVAPHGFGFGDVKVGGIVGGYLGWFSWLSVFYGVFAGFLLGSLVAVAVLASGRGTRKTAIPFGPMLMFGPLLVLAFDLVPSSLG